MVATTRVAGGCHCGTIRFTYSSAVAPEDAEIRECQCDFCRRHGARNISDPAGSAEILVARADALIRYRFAAATADFLLCGACGCYVAAYLPGTRGTGYSTINVNCLDDREPFARDARPVVYDAEDTAARVSRRRQRWTPTVLEITDDSPTVPMR